ncbi:MAG: S8 family serine peptidase [Anaerolineae bacterium]
MVKNRSKWFVVVLISLVTALLVPWNRSLVHGLEGGSGLNQAYPPPSTPTPISPPPTLTPILPTLTPTPVPETEIALDYIAAREGIPVEQLFVANQHRREYGLLGRAFWFVKALDQQSGHFYTAMVDLDDHSVVELEKIERAQREAREARYGKLEPQLYELLQTKGPEDEVKVAIWFTSIDFPAILAQLKTKYPQVASRLLLERPWRGVTDKALAAQIRADYFQLLEEAHLARQKPLAQLLRAQGYVVKVHRGTPSLSARLPKHVILQIEQRPNVARIYLIEGKLVPLLDSAIPTARGNVVWDREFQGTGVRISIVEAGIVEAGHPSINVVAARQVVPPNHYTAGVASAAASHHFTYKGMAPEAEIVSAGVNGRADQWDDVDDAILWAYNNYGATIMNASFTSQTGERSDDMQWIDRVFDYYARYDNIIFTVAAGNQEQGNHIGSPGKAYNVITVGGTDDKGNSAWSDDTMWSFSAWNNPKRDDGSYGDREKPEVVASATNLTLLNLNNGTWESSGTSFSSPQVAGLAALLCQRNSELCNAPEAMKAIIMASAVHNVDGPSNVPTGQDLKDGAGAIDAALADTTAITGFADSWGYPYPACERPCWWSNSIYNHLPGDPPHFPPGTYRYYYFKASEGERIRAALTWESYPAGPGSNYWQDPLETDLDLRIFDPDWQALDAIGGYSASNDNNYELVEFTAPKTGEYKIGVYKKQSQEVANWLGLAWTKEATYLPDIKANFGGWTSDITIRNDGARR